MKRTYRVVYPVYIEAEESIPEDELFELWGEK